MTEKEKAKNYLQMLKAEGKLDENAIPELTSMYNITHDEAIEMLADFKNTEEYKVSADRNLHSNITTLLVFLFFASCFAFASFGQNGFRGFSIYFLFFAIGCLGAFILLLQRLKERFSLKERFPWLKNKSMPLLVCAIILCLVFFYRNNSQTYNVNPNTWFKIPNVVLKNYREIKTKESDYYELDIDDYFDPFIYDSKEHLYQFIQNPLDSVLKRGDTISLWVEKNKEPELRSSSRNKVWDIEVKGKRLLDVTARNKAAIKIKERNNKISLAVFGFALLAFAYMQTKQRVKIS